MKMMKSIVFTIFVHYERKQKMKHHFKRWAALALTAATVLSFSVAAMPFAFGAGETTPTASGKTPIAAFDFKKDLADHSGRTDLDPVELFDESSANPKRTTEEMLKSTSPSGNARWTEKTGIRLQNGFFKLPDNIFSDTDISKIDGFTLSFTVNKSSNPNGYPWEVLFSFADKDYYADKANTNWLPEGERSDTSIHMVYHGCIGSGTHPYYNDYGGGCWVDGALNAYDKPSSKCKMGEDHEITVTYETANNTLFLYVDGAMVSSSKAADWTVKAKLTNEDIKNLTSLVIGRSNDGYEGWWGYATYKDLTIYSTALTAHEVRALAHAETVEEGWEAVKNMTVESEPVLVKDALVLDGEGDGTFTAAALNVDGLPAKLNVTAFGRPYVYFGKDMSVSLNEGDREAATSEMSKILAKKGWDILAVSENFNYHGQLAEALTKDNVYGEIYGNTGFIPETVELFDNTLDTYIGNFCNKQGNSFYFKPLDTDGLGLFYKTDSVDVDAKQVDKVKWAETYSTYHDLLSMMQYYVPTENGADDLITKGFRHFTATIDGVLTVDVYTLHMDANDDPGDNNARMKQMNQLADEIIKSNTKNPIIIMGDTNCRYTRDPLLTDFIGKLNATDNLYAKDAWVETKNNGEYPEFGSKVLDSEIVDKIIYVNNTESAYQLSLTKYTKASIEDDNDKALSDHSAVVGTFAYAKKCTVTYSDGVDGAAFKTQTINTLSTNKIPAFVGTPERDGYEFAGWKPAITDTDTVTGNMEFVATWTAKTDDTTAKTDDTTAKTDDTTAKTDDTTKPADTTKPGSAQPSTTGDTAHTLVWVSVCAVSMIGAAVVICGKSKGGKKE